MPNPVHRGMLEYREALRHLWCSVFHPRCMPTESGALLDAFERVSELLFGVMVADLLVGRAAGEGGAVPAVVVPPRRSILVNRERESRSHCWDNPVVSSGESGVRGAFQGFFDWDQVGPRDFAYCMVDIEQFDEHPELVGYTMLVSVGEGNVQFE